MIDITDSLGETRFLMPLESMKVTKAFKVFGDDAGSPDLIPIDQRVPCDMNGAIELIKDQDGVGQCNCEATVYCAEGTRVQTGLKYVELSAANLYGRINGGRDAGSMLEDAIKEINANGVCKATTVGRVEWHPNKWPASWKEEAKQFKILEWWWCPTTAHMFSAIQRGFFCNLGVMWGSSDSPDADGWLPDHVSGRTGGHAICRCSIVNRNGKWGLGGPNSWSTKWGKEGRMIISEARLKAEENNFGWWAARAVTYSNSDPIPQPK